MSSIKVLSRTQKIVVNANGSISIVNAGPVGPRGFVGPVGPQGIPGDQGPQGAPGDDVDALAAILAEANARVAGDTDLDGRLDDIEAAFPLRINPLSDPFPLIAVDADVVHKAGPETITGLKTFAPLLAAQVGVLVKAAAAQTADLLQLQSSAAAVLTRFNAAGSLGIGRDVVSAAHSIEAAKRIFSVTMLEVGGEPSNPSSYIAPNTGAIGSLVFNKSSTVGATSSGSGSTLTLQEGANQKVDIRGRLFIDHSGASNAVGNVPLILKMVAVQTGDAVQIQNSAGTVLAKIDASGKAFVKAQEWQNALSTVMATMDINGNLTVPQITTDILRATPGDLTVTVPNAGTVNINGASTSNTPKLAIRTGQFNFVGMTIQGLASQTADLFQLRNSANVVMSKIMSDGVITAPAIALGAAGPNPAIPLMVQTVAAGNVGAVIKAAAAQTADLLQLQDSAGTVKAKIDASGAITTFDTLYIAHSTGKNARLTATNVGALMLRGSNADYHQFIIQAKASQVDDLLQIQDSAAAVLARITAAGRVRAPEVQVDSAYFAATHDFMSTTAAQRHARLVRANAWTDSVQSNLLQFGGIGNAVLNSRTDAESTTSLNRLLLGSKRVQISGDPYSTTPLPAAALTVSVMSTIPSDVGLLVKLAAVQTGDAFQILDSVATELASVNASGALFALQTISTPGSVYLGPKAGKQARLSPTTAGALLLRGSSQADYHQLIIQAKAAQTQELMLFQNDVGGVLTRVAANGAIAINGAVQSGYYLTVNGGLGAYLLGQNLVVSNATNVVPLTVKAFAAQTSNIQEWQTAASSVVASVDPAGIFVLGGVQVKTVADTFGRMFLKTTGSVIEFGPGNIARDTTLGRGGVARLDTNSDVDFTDNTKGPIVRSPNGTRYRVIVNDAGALSTVAA